MVGYGEDVKGYRSYRIYFQKYNSLETMRDVVFLKQAQEECSVRL